MHDKSLEEFCKRYEARIARTGQYYRRAEPSPWRIPGYYETTTIKNVDFLNITEVPMTSIILPEDRLGALVEHEQRVSDFVEPFHRGPHVNKYQHLEAQIAEHEIECRLRHTNPALKKAWDNNQMLLRLVR